MMSEVNSASEGELNLDSDIVSEHNAEEGGYFGR